MNLVVVLNPLLTRRFHTSASRWLRSVKQLPRSLEEFKEIMEKPPQPKVGNFLKVAIVGDPNVGKSTLINKLVGADLCSVSRKAHTTRTSTRLADSSTDLQLVYVDTPGAVNHSHARKHKLPKEMVVSPSKALENPVDVLGVVVDCSDHWRRDFLSLEVLRLLERHRSASPEGSSVLILNKVDRLRSKRKLLSCVETLCDGTVGGKQVIQKRKTSEKLDLKEKIWRKEEEKQRTGDEEQVGLAKPERADPGTFNPAYPPRLESWPFFERVFMVSALEEDGLADLKAFLESKATSKPWEFRTDLSTEQNPVEIVMDIVRAQLLDLVPNEIPYVVVPTVSQWRIDESNNVHIDIVIETRDDRQMRAILGPDGKTIKKVTDRVRQKLCNLFLTDVALKVIVNKK